MTAHILASIPPKSTRTLVPVVGKNGRVQYLKPCPACSISLIDTRKKNCHDCRRKMCATEAAAISQFQIFEGIPCRSIPLTQGYVAWVDEARFEDVARWKWSADIGPVNVYAIRNHDVAERREKGKASISMHRYLKGDPSGMLVDHRDGDGLHNWDSNLREATYTQNAWNQKLRERTYTGIKGVKFHRARGKYQASICSHGKSVSLGYFATAEEAGAAYAREASAFHGEFSSTHRNKSA